MNDCAVKIWVGLLVLMPILAGCQAISQSKQASHWSFGQAKPLHRVNAFGVPSHYQVRSGDTLSKIASRYGLSWRALSKLNHLDDKHTIYVGQWLILWQKDNESSDGLTFAKSTASNNLHAQQSSSVKQEVPSSVPQQAAELTYAPPPSQININIKQQPVRLIEPVIVEPILEAPVQKQTMQLTTAQLTKVMFAYPVHGIGMNAVVRQFGTPINHGLTEGMFFAGRDGDAILASFDGQVLKVDAHAVRPVVVIEHGNGYVSSYFDISNVQVRQGQMVAQGDVLGQMSSQTASGIALFEFRLAKDGNFINPTSVLQ